MQPSHELLAGADMLRRGLATTIMPYFRNLKENEAEVTGTLKTASGLYKDFRTIADQKMEDFVVAECRRSHPNSRVVGEEMCKPHPEHLNGLEKGSVMIVDSLDGTSPFYHGQSGFGVLFSRQEKGKTEAGWNLRTYTGKNGEIENEIIMADMAGGVWHSPSSNEPFVPLKRVSPSVVPQQPIGIATVQYFNRGLLNHEDMLYEGLKRPKDEIADAKLGLVVREAGSAVDLWADLALGKIHYAVSTPTRPWDNTAGAFINRQLGGVDRQLDAGGKYSPTRLDGGLMASSSKAIMDAVSIKLFKAGTAPMRREPCVWDLLLPRSQSRYAAQTLGRKQILAQMAKPKP